MKCHHHQDGSEVLSLDLKELVLIFPPRTAPARPCPHKANESVFAGFLDHVSGYILPSHCTEVCQDERNSEKYREVQQTTMT